jgi:hypothetical protein
VQATESYCAQASFQGENRAEMRNECRVEGKLRGGGPKREDRSEVGQKIGLEKRSYDMQRMRFTFDLHFWPRDTFRVSELR